MDLELSEDSNCYYQESYYCDVILCVYMYVYVCAYHLRAVTLVAIKLLPYQGVNRNA